MIYMRTFTLTLTIIILFMLYFTLRVAIINTNDEPFVSLAGGAPGVQELTFDYTEGDGPELITPQLVVVDTDPTAMIQRYNVLYTEMLLN